MPLRPHRSIPCSTMCFGARTADAGRHRTALGATPWIHCIGRPVAPARAAATTAAVGGATDLVRVLDASRRSHRVQHGSPRRAGDVDRGHSPYCDISSRNCPVGVRVTARTGDGIHQLSVGPTSGPEVILAGTPSDLVRWLTGSLTPGEVTLAVQDAHPLGPITIDHALGPAAAQHFSHVHPAMSTLRWEYPFDGGALIKHAFLALCRFARRYCHEPGFDVRQGRCVGASLECSARQGNQYGFALFAMRVTANY